MNQDLINLLERAVVAIEAIAGLPRPETHAYREEPPEEVKPSRKASKPTPVPDAAEKPAKAAEPAALSRNDVIAALKKLAQATNNSRVQALLEEFGAKTVGQLDTAIYGDVIAEAERQAADALGEAEAA